MGFGPEPYDAIQYGPLGDSPQNEALLTEDHVLQTLFDGAVGQKYRVPKKPRFGKREN